MRAAFALVVLAVALLAAAAWAPEGAHASTEAVRARLHGQIQAGAGAEAEAEAAEGNGRRRFIGKALKNFGKNIINKGKENLHRNLFGRQDPVPAAQKAGVPDPKGAANRVQKVDERCVICQYLVQRVNAELLLNGVGGGVPLSAPNGEFANAARDAAAGRLTQGAATGQHGDPFHNSNAGAMTPPPPSIGTTGEQQAVDDQQQGEANTNLLEVERRERREGGFIDGLIGGVGAIKAVSGGVEGMKEADLFNQGLKRKDFLPGGKAWRTPRERHIGLMAFRPTQRRYVDMRDGPLRAAKRAEERYEENQMFSVAYQTLEDLCTKRMPAPYYGYCGLLMKNYERIAQGLRWKDRPDSICMGMGFCSATSYVQKGPHAVYRAY